MPKPCSWLAAPVAVPLLSFCDVATILATILVVPATTRADTIDVTVTSTVAFAIPNGHLLPVLPGDSVTLQFTIDGDAPDQNPVTGFGDFPGAITDVVLDLPDSGPSGLSFQFAGGASDVLTQDDLGAAPFVLDGLTFDTSAGVTGSTIDGDAVTGLTFGLVQLASSSPTLIVDERVNAPFTFGGNTTSASQIVLRGIVEETGLPFTDVISLNPGTGVLGRVPEPAAAWLLATAGARLGLWARRPLATRTRRRNGGRRLRA